MIDDVKQSLSLRTGKKHWRFVGIGDRLHFHTETSSCQIMLNHVESPWKSPLNPIEMWEARCPALPNGPNPSAETSAPLQVHRVHRVHAVAFVFASGVAGSAQRRFLRPPGSLRSHQGLPEQNSYDWNWRNILAMFYEKNNTMHSRTAKIFHIISVFELGV